MPILTRAEAQERRALIDVREYAVHLDLTGADADEATFASPPTFFSRSTISFTCAQPGASTFVEAWAEDITFATLNGADLDLTGLHEGRLPLPSLEPDNELVIEGRFRYSRTGEGLHRYRDPQDGLVYLYSQTFLNDAQRVFACFDQPDLKAPYRMMVRIALEGRVVGHERAPVAGARPAPAPLNQSTVPPITLLLNVNQLRMEPWPE